MSCDASRESTDVKARVNVILNEHHEQRMNIGFAVDMQVDELITESHRF